MSKEAMKLALEALESKYIVNCGAWRVQQDQAITALREALAEQPAQQDSTCSNALRAQGKAYPRTCKKCGLGPCVELAQQALDKKAENARELGLDYEPAQQEPCGGCGGSGWVSRDPDIGTDQECFVCEGKGTVEPEQPAQRTWVGLDDKDYRELHLQMGPTYFYQDYGRAIEAKLKEKNNG